jgi:ParB family chromosome partitioning protein
MKKASGLGKGLSALISERKIDIDTFAENNGKRLEVDILDVFPGRFQPRVIFDADELEELAESIRRNGVIQPILVKKRPGQGCFS